MHWLWVPTRRRCGALRQMPVTSWPPASLRMRRRTRLPGVSCSPIFSAAGGFARSRAIILPITPLYLLLIDLMLTAWLSVRRLEGLRVGASRVYLQFWRTRHGKTRYRVLRREGPLLVLLQPAPNCPEATLYGRLRAALTSAI